MISIAQHGYGDKIPKPLLYAVTINGPPYSVPLNMHLENILYYNKKLFDELKLAAPTGYDDFVAACKAIKAAKPGMVCLAVVAFSLIVLLGATIDSFIFSFFSSIELEKSILLRFLQQGMFPGIYTAIISLVLVMFHPRRNPF